MDEENKGKLKNYSLRVLFLALFFICLLLVLFLFLSQDAKATEVSGHITSDTTWNASANPYLVKGDLYVDRGINLTIEPGVTVKFDKWTKFIIDGNLIAIGNETDKIIFTSNATNPSPMDWEGIRVRNAGRAFIDYCEILYGENGFWADGSSNSSITNTNFTKCHWTVYLYFSSNITIHKINISNSYVCFVISRSTNIALSEVHLWNNTIQDIAIKSGDSPEKRYYNHTIEDCTINGKPIYYYFEKQDIRLEGLDAGAIIIAWSHNITVSQSTVINGAGISLYYSNNCTITDSYLSNNWEGIYLEYSPYEIEDRNFLHNYITNNIVENNSIGIFLYHSPDEEVNNSHNIITGNIVHNNSNGIRVVYSDNNEIEANNITSNEYGIYIWFSDSNWIYHNNFIDNEAQVDGIEGSGNYNYWRHNEEGNYWDDYSGDDDEGDGIGDSSYIISSYSRDYYPLMNPWTGSLPPDTTPPFFLSNPIIFDFNIILPNDEFEIRIRGSEQGHYEIIIDTDRNGDFDNMTDSVLRGTTPTNFQTINWDCRDDEGDYIEDGSYEVQILIWDNAGNQVEEPFDAGNVSIVLDSDSDGVRDIEDPFPDDPNEWEDTDGDGIGDNSDTDWDNDGFLNHEDVFPMDRNEWRDSDGDGIGDNADPDDNDNNIPDIAEIPLAIVIILIPFITIYFVNKRIKGKKEEK